MYKVHLFLGFPVDSNFSIKLDQINPAIRTLFIKSEENYLHEVQKNNQCYLGKLIPNKSELPALEMLEANIYSLLKRLVPDYPYENVPLALFPVPESSTHQ